MGFSSMENAAQGVLWRRFEGVALELRGLVGVREGQLERCECA